MLNRMKFISHDRDDDIVSYYCAHSDGGWWYNSCGYLELNDDPVNIEMYLNGEWHSPSLVEIKMRPLNCNIN